MAHGGIYAGLRRRPRQGAGRRSLRGLQEDGAGQYPTVRRSLSHARRRCRGARGRLNPEAAGHPGISHHGAGQRMVGLVRICRPQGAAPRHGRVHHGVAGRTRAATLKTGAWVRRRLSAPDLPHTIRRSMLKTSPFHPRTSALVRAQTWRRWAGYQMASAYDPHPDREYAAIRSAAALLDVSPLYKYWIAGRDATRLLDRMITRDMTKLKPGQVYYTPWCDAAGKVIDDGTVSRLGENTYRFTSADSSLRWLHMNAVGMDVQIEDVSERVGALSLQGPLSRAILSEVSAVDLSALK